MIARFVLAFALAFAGAWLLSCSHRVAPSAPETYAVPASPIAPPQASRGQYLAEAVTGCWECHSERDFSKPGGPVRIGTSYGGNTRFTEHYVFQGEPIPGRIPSSNISSHPQFGIGDWTPEEIDRAIRQGVSKDGRLLYPLMPYLNYRHLTPYDAQAIVLYLMDLSPRETEQPERQLHIPEIALAEFTDLPPAPLEPTDLRSQGEYLVRIAGCQDCHTPQGADDAEMAGGVRIAAEDFEIVSPNLTPDEATGWGKATEADFIRAMRKGIAFDRTGEGRQQLLHPVMPWAFYRNMTTEDLHAIWVYLRSLPPVPLRVR